MIKKLKYMIKNLKWFLYKCPVLYLKEKEYFIKNSR